MIDPWLILAIVAAGAAVLAISRGATTSGLVAGSAMTAWFAARGGWPVLCAWILLVLLGVAVSRIGYARKAARAAAQPGHARRSARHAVANGGIAALALLLPDAELARLAAIGALAAALSDTVSSELGLLSRHPPRRLLFGAPCRPGDDGGMSLSGTLYGLLAAGLVAGVVRPFPGVSTAASLAVIGGATAGNLTDSLLGATVESKLPRTIHNEIVNLLATAAGAAVTLLLLPGGPS